MLFRSSGVYCDLATNPCASTFGSINETYAAYLSFNALDQITRWGGANPDYGSKQWGGMVKTLHYPRWQAFIEYLYSLKKNGTSNAYSAAYVLELGTNITETWENTKWNELEIAYEATGNLWLILDEVLPRYT